jgi:hypothetical protein
MTVFCPSHAFSGAQAETVGYTACGRRLSRQRSFLAGKAMSRGGLRRSRAAIEITVATHSLAGRIKNHESVLTENLDTDRVGMGESQTELERPIQRDDFA